MKKLFILALITLISFSSFGQITLTGDTHTPQVGDTYSYIVANQDATEVNVFEDGANVTWDLSFIQGNFLNSIGFVALGSSSEPSNFPDANLVEIGSDVELYHYASATGIVLEGILIPNVERVVYSTPRQEMTFPMTYQDSSGSTFSGTIEYLSVNASLNRTGSVSIVADGYGSLILPSGNYDDVLKVTVTANYSDEVGGVVVSKYDEKVVAWYDAGHKTYLAQYASLVVNDTIVVSSSYAYLNPTSSVSSIDFEEKVGKLFPNPTTNSFTISTDNNRDGLIDVEIFNAIGAKVKSLNGINLDSQIDVSGLKPGIYFVTYFVDGKAHTGKLIKE